VINATRRTHGGFNYSAIGIARYSDPLVGDSLFSHRRDAATTTTITHAHTTICRTRLPIPKQQYRYYCFRINFECESRAYVSNEREISSLFERVSDLSYDWQIDDRISAIILIDSDMIRLAIDFEHYCLVQKLYDPFNETIKKQLAMASLRSSLGLRSVRILRLDLM